MNEHVKSLTALRNVLAYAVREISLVQGAPDSAILAVANAYAEVDRALALAAGDQAASEIAAADAAHLN